MAALSAASGDSSASARAQHPSDSGLRRRFARGRLAFRRWRHARPFWGGLLVVLGAAEILLSEKAPLPLMIHIGLQGLAGYLIPVVMILCGLLLLFHPVQQTFYSILAILLALGTWVTANLGGFFVGMVLGLVGGSLAFAWQPPDERETRPRRRQAPPPHEPSAGLALIRREPPAGAAPDGPRAGEEGDPGASLRFPTAALAMNLAIPLAPVAPLALSMLLTPAALTSSSAPWGPTGITPSPTPAASSQTPPPAPSASPDHPPTPTSGPTVTPTPGASPAPSPGHAHHRKRRHVPLASGPGGQLSAAKVRLDAGLLTFAGVSFDGIANVPTAAGLTPMLKFSMDSLKLSGSSTLTVTEAGHALVTRENLGFRGDVVFYATEVSGRLRGVRVTFSPDRPPTGLRPKVTLTDVVAYQPCVRADSLLAGEFWTWPG